MFIRYREPRLTPPLDTQPLSHCYHSSLQPHTFTNRLLDSQRNYLDEFWDSANVEVEGDAVLPVDWTVAGADINALGADLNAFGATFFDVLTGGGLDTSSAGPLHIC